MAASPAAAGRWRTWGSVLAWGWRATPGWFSYTAALLLISAISTIVYPVGLALVIDASLRHRPDQIILGVAVVAGLYALTWAVNMLAGTAAAGLSDRTALYLSTRVAEQLNAVSTIDHLERPAYLTELDLLRENLRLLSNGARQMLVTAQILVRTLGIVVILAVVYPPLALLPLCGIAPVAGERISVGLRQRTDERLAPDRRLADELFQLATSAAPAKELRVYGTAGPLRDRHRSLARAVNSGTTRAALIGGGLGALGWLVFAAGFVVGIAVVVVRAAHGTATVGQVVLAVTLIQRAQTQVGQAAATVGQLLTTSRTARRLLWLEDYVAADRAARQGKAAPPATLTSGITLREVTFGYPPDGATVLDGIDLHLPAGSAVAVVGENGAGKTTLVKLLTGMYQPISGQVLIDGVPLNTIDLTAWRDRTAATFQDFVQFELLAGQTVGLGDLPRLDDETALTAALHRADASTVAAELPEGLATPLGRSFSGGQDLSGGQWQRLALARGMMRDLPLLLILDEPTASLDALTEAALFERYLAARTLARESGAITLLVSHRFSTVRMADLIVVLDQGRIAAAGDHATLIRSGGLYAELYELQARAYR
ncbi:MAG TPA: ABC transporter ATP-binding protein [Streptosporangiaceae bacterium]|nr:ABC transporter ATP-binding protein [Streptosporangiaceae bacterium]